MMKPGGLRMVGVALTAVMCAVAAFVFAPRASEQPAGAVVEAQTVQEQTSREWLVPRRDRDWAREWSERNDVEAEIALLSSPEALERARAAARLRDIGMQSRYHMVPEEERLDISAAVPELIALLADDSPLLSTNVHPLRAALQQTSPGHEAAGALGEMRPPPIDALRAVLREPPSDFALARAVHAVGSGRLTELAPEVVALTRHQNPEVRLEAYQTIALSGVGSVSSLRASIPDERQELAALLHLHAHADLAPGLEAVERELVSPLQERRHAAAEAVVEIFSSTRPQEARDRIFPRLLAAVADEPDAKVRERLVLALGRVRADAALLTETLLAVLRDDPAEEVRARAAGTLAFVDAHPVRERVAALVDALDDDSLKVRNSAVQALHNMYRTDLITPERMPDLPDLEERLRARLMVALATEEQAVSNWAARIVAQIPAPDTVDEFLRLLGERKCVFQVASTLFTLAPDDPRLVPAVDALVRDETVHDSTRRELAQRLHLLVTGERWAVPEADPVEWWLEHGAEAVR